MYLKMKKNYRHFLSRLANVGHKAKVLIDPGIICNLIIKTQVAGSRKSGLKLISGPQQQEKNNNRKTNKNIQKKIVLVLNRVDVLDFVSLNKIPGVIEGDFKECL